ncbi:MAG: hypothetical protein AUJ02_05325 [Chloroflexi bacterium 13_1_40CM_3_65_12]|nr:MAG: hypothetical protein AUJ02_05325 [Chloroflexi bacterium 13_1_40CM_3_65_12]
MRVPTSWRFALAAALLLASACGGGSTPGVLHSPSPVQGALAGGFIAYLNDKGIGVVDPATGKSTMVAPLPGGGGFRASGPVWAPAPGVSYPVLYFTIHDDRAPERRTTTGVVPYDWLFRADPFTGVIEPVAASADLQSNGPFGIVANAHYLALTVGCCANYEVDAFDLTRPPSAPKVLAKPPTQAAMFTEGAAPGADGLIAVRAVGTGAWYWLNPTAAVLNPFPLSLGPEDGPIAISANGTLAAISLPDRGPVILPINVAAPAAPVSPAAGGTPASSPAASPIRASPLPSAAPRHVNSKLTHADALAWSPDAKNLAVAVNGEIQIYSATGADGAAPLNRFLTGANITGVDWSAPVANKSLALVKPNNGPQPFVDALLDATKLPAAADSPAARAQTKVYLWQFDSTKSSPIAAITDSTPAVLQQYPPLPAGVVFHHWAPSTTWELLGGCTRYRVVITGSVPPTASTFGLASNTLCNAPAVSPTPSPSPSK